MPFDLVVVFYASGDDNFLTARLQQYGELHLDAIPDGAAAQTYLRRAVRHVCANEARYVRPDRTVVRLGVLRADAAAYADMQSLYAVSGAPERMRETAVEPMLSDAAWASLLAQAAAARRFPQRRALVVARVGVLHRARTLE